MIDGRTRVGDAELAARIAAGDEAAFMTVYDRHGDLVFGSVIRFLGDREAAAEVAQDTFLALWRRAAQFDAESGSLAGWLMGIARHRAIDRVRAEARRPIRGALPLDSLAAPADERAERGGDARAGVPLPDDGPEPTEVVDTRWVKSVVRTGVSELPPDEREVLALAYARGLSQSEIADELALPLGTVKSRTRRAMARLRGRLLAVPDLLDDLDVAAAPAQGTGR